MERTTCPGAKKTMKIPTLNAEIFCRIEYFSDDRMIAKRALQRPSYWMRRQITPAALIPGNHNYEKPAFPWRRSAGLLLMAFLWFWGGLIPSAGAQDSRGVQHPAGGYSIYVVPHSHMDLEWMWTQEQSEAFSIRILRQALRMLKEDPRFRRP
jgi:Glycosyl hydrolases family 38 N-terminal domain